MIGQGKHPAFAENIMKEENYQKRFSSLGALVTAKCGGSISRVAINTCIKYLLQVGCISQSEWRQEEEEQSDKSPPNCLNTYLVAPKVSSLYTCSSAPVVADLRWWRVHQRSLRVRCICLISTVESLFSTAHLFGASSVLFMLFPELEQFSFLKLAKSSFYKKFTNRFDIFGKCFKHGFLGIVAQCMSLEQEGTDPMKACIPSGCIFSSSMIFHAGWVLGQI